MDPSSAQQSLLLSFLSHSLTLSLTHLLSPFGFFGFDLEILMKQKYVEGSVSKKVKLI